MRKINSLVFIILWFWLALFAWNFSYAKDYEYKNLDIQADIKIDWTIDIKETFTTDFLERRHWIIRIIPLDYPVSWEKFRIDISNVHVKWTRFQTAKNNWNLEIKIWDKDKTVIWEQIYPISYSAYWLIRNFSWMWYSELYWNVVWYDFDTNIDSVYAEINLPKRNSFSSGDFLITVDWKENSVWTFAWMLDWSQWDKIIITYDKILSAFEWITLAIKFPNDYFEFNNEKQNSLLLYEESNRFNFKNFGWFAKSIIVILWFLMLFFWARFISNLLSKRIVPVNVWRNFESKYPVIVQYTPPKWMSSAEAWLLFNCRVDPVDMTSLFYKWKNEKIILINCIKKTSSSKDIQRVVITKLKTIPDNAPLYEKDFYYTIFRKQDTVIIDKDTKLNFLSSLYTLEDYGIRKKWLCRRNKTSFLSYFLLIILFLCLIPLFYYFGWIWILIRIFVVPVIYWCSIKSDYKIKLTDEWKKLASHVIWYAKFIKECDANKLKLFLEEDPLYVDKVLPYAVAFGLETEFLKKTTPLIEDLNKNMISWSLIDLWSMISFMRSSVSFAYPKSSAIIPVSLIFWFFSGGSEVFGDSGWWFSSWSSFWWWFSRGWWGGWWGSRSW